MINYEKLFAKNAYELTPSKIRKFFDLANEMDDVISLSVGQPDFKTPRNIREAGIQSLEDGKTWYTANAGMAELREEICIYLKRRFGLSYTKDETIVTVGGSEGIDIALRAFLNPGDEIIVPEPCFVSYAPIASLIGAKVVPLETKAEDNFKVTPKLLSEAITDKTKMLILAYPNNPTGAIMTKEDLEGISEILRETDIIVLSDEIYAELTFGGKHCSIASIEGMRERTVLVNGFSKAYSMTGWRMGYVCAPMEIIEQLYKIHQYAIMCAPSTSQYAAIEALRNSDVDIEEMKEEYDIRRRVIVKGFRDLGCPCFEPEGAFYIFPQISQFGMSSNEFCEKLLYSERVAVIPGNAFGDCGEGFIRVSYCYSIKHIKTALERLSKFIEGIKK